jgi:hypothetical protein
MNTKYLQDPVDELSGQRIFVLARNGSVICTVSRHQRESATGVADVVSRALGGVVSVYEATEETPGAVLPGQHVASYQHEWKLVYQASESSRPEEAAMYHHDSHPFDREYTVE